MYSTTHVILPYLYFMHAQQAKTFELFKWLQLTLSSVKV